MTTTTPRDVSAADQRPLPKPLPIIRAEGARKQFGDVAAVVDLTLTVPAGVICAMVGPSGSGKTTAIRLLTGYYSPTGGRVEVMGVQPTRFSVYHRERIGYVPQQFALYPNLTVAENLSFASSLYGMGMFGRAKRHRELLELVDLWEHRHQRTQNISGGMKRRLALICGIVHGPRLLFLDEPTAGIDPILRAKLWDELRRLSSEGRTLVVTTQYVTEAEYCDLVALMDGGRVVAFGTPEDLRRQAVGSEELELEAKDLSRTHLERLWALDGVRGIERVGVGHYRIAVDDASIALPAAVSAMQEVDCPVDALRVYRPNFDEVFVRLVEHERAAQGRVQ